VIVVDVRVVVVVVVCVASAASDSAGVCAGRTVANVARIKQTATNVPMVTVLLKTVPSRSSA